MPPSELADLPQSVAELQRQLDELAAELRERTAERDEALAREAAIAEVLQVINCSPGELASIFDAIVEKAHALCGAAYGSLQLWDGQMFRGVAMRGFPDAMVEALRRGYSPGPNHPCRLLLDGERIVYCADMAAVDDPVTREGAKLSSIRSVLYVALRKDDALLGQIVAGRQQVQPFTAKEIALVENFAAQAVIAIENVRLLGELRERTRDLEEALEYQTATSDVLRVISGSVFNLEPVLKTVVSTAIRLCRADEAVIYRNVDGEYRWAAGNSLASEYERIEREVRIRPGTGTLVGRAALDGRTVHILDAWADPLYEAKDDACIGGVRTMLGVPLMRDGQPIAVIGLARRHVEAYTEKEIELVRTFADQAVIAIENARLLTETREALEQQTATAEVLQVINSSPGDLAPVFQAIVASAAPLCEAEFTAVARVDDDGLLHLVAINNLSPEETAAFHSLFPRSPARNFAMGRAFVDGRPAQFEDVLAEPDYDARTLDVLQSVAQYRSFLGVPILREGRSIGVIGCARREVKPFTTAQIALLENFAAQAVIAMENARLLTETREALEQQTATAEVLQVINSSPGDLAPVFDAILENAHGLCRIALGALELHENGKFRAVAVRGVSGPLAELLRQPFEPPPESPLARLIAGEQVVQITDMSELARRRPDDPRAQAGAQYGLHTALFVPLRKDAALLGQMVAFRQEERPFSEREIALLQNFAAQAVIAMENARLLTETREALEQQTATSEVLQVINSSLGDLKPVFDAILEKAHALCGVTIGALEIWDGERIRALATRGLPASFEELIRDGYQPGPSDPHWQLLDGARFVHISDQIDVEEPTHQKSSNSPVSALS